MTLDGANIFNENDTITIYTMNSIQTGQYSAVVPKNMNDKVNMLVDLNMKSSFDALINNTKDKDSLVKEIEEEYSNIAGAYPSGVLVLPMLDLNELTDSINSNDKQKMLDETKKIGSITSELYNKLSSSGIDKSKINQKIVIVEKTDIDNKFVNWLKEQMPDFVDGVSYDELKTKGVDTSVNPFTGDVSAAAEPVNDIFGAPATEAPATEVTPVEVSESTGAGTPAIDSNTQTVEPQVSEDTDAIAEPKPITDTKLETTQAIPNDLEKAENKVETPATDSNTVETHEIDKKSGGFANLLILMVILVGVTIASIELGKILYNTFGS
ncbi:MAG: hypothetical protein IKF19_04180 [Bacilli bacterium]|nr:hypothetical protein [Bacilli bacterium]